MENTITTTDNNTENVEISSDLSSPVQQIVNDIPSEFTDDDSKTEPQTTPKKAGPVDKHGNTFNPDHHYVDDEGKPKLSGKGLLCLKPGKRNIPKKCNNDNGKSDIVIPENGSDEQSNQSNNSSTPIDPIKFQVAGAIAAETIFSMGQMFGGAEWAPVVDKKQGINEREFMTDSFTAYFTAKEISDLPPGLVLLAALGSYTGKRIAPVVKAKIAARNERDLNKNGEVK